MGHKACALMWIKHLRREHNVVFSKLLLMYCINQATIYIASNPMFHEHIKKLIVALLKTLLPTIYTPFTNSKEKVNILQRCRGKMDLQNWLTTLA